ncbi:MAG TPA: hypothetical protein PLK90_03335 [Clostridiales bacterium]|jgi:alpha-galactosidase|nr:hypothetical protein [Clostridiales bacterium]HQP69413.1 hypothetical protein [Clostridiales bacterium]
MKNFALIIILSVIGAAFASTSIINLGAEYSSGLVKIEWKSTTETNVKEFIIEKSSDGTTFGRMTSENPKGSSSDYTVFDMSPHSKRAVLYYRIKVLDFDGSVQTSSAVSVNVSTAGISATWGSIKAMFR